MRGRRSQTRSRMCTRCVIGTHGGRQGAQEERTRKHRVVEWFKGTSHAAELLSRPATALHHLLQKKEMKHREQVTTNRLICFYLSEAMEDPTFLPSSLV